MESTTWTKTIRQSVSPKILKGHSSKSWHFANSLPSGRQSCFAGNGRGWNIAISKNKARVLSKMTHQKGKNYMNVQHCYQWWTRIWLVSSLWTDELFLWLCSPPFVWVTVSRHTLEGFAMVLQGPYSKNVEFSRQLKISIFLLSPCQRAPPTLCRAPSTWSAQPTADGQSACRWGLQSWAWSPKASLGTGCGKSLWKS